MKELSIEEKAKAYDGALERAKKQLEGANVFDYKEGQIAHDIRTTTYAIFPELKESEDEKIMKALIKLVKKAGEGYENVIDGVSIENAISWLEKQGEQKPAWSEDDKHKFKVGDKIQYKNYSYTIEEVNEDGYVLDSGTTITFNQQNEWQLTPENRVVPQPNPQWNEEDEKNIEYIINKLRTINDEKHFTCISWLKSIKDRYTWKPSDEQMKVMSYLAKYYAVGIDEPNRSIITSLYEDLKKLREENV